MTVSLVELVSALDALLEPQRYQDYCPNGLQVEGRSRVARLVSGVTACQDLIDAAVAWEADAILVHHGYFWRGESPCITGIKRARLASLLRHDISLLAYHLPLDGHPGLGNNACFGRLLGVEAASVQALDAEPLVQAGVLPAPLNGARMASRLCDALGREPLHIAADRDITHIAWCTGAAQGFIDHAVDIGADAFVTGEVSEQTVHIARESGIHFFAAGHHATERYGVQAVAGAVASSLAIQHRFIDIENPA